MWSPLQNRDWSRITGRVVRCRRGHVFATVWVPGASLTAFRLGPRLRYQRCPVGRHWSLVRPVPDDELTPELRAEAEAHRDGRLP